MLDAGVRSKDIVNIDQQMADADIAKIGRYISASLLKNLKFIKTMIGVVVIIFEDLCNILPHSRTGSSHSPPLMYCSCYL